MDKSISRAHARVDFNKDICVLVDMGSSLGTQVNGEPIAKKVLQPGDRIVLGRMTVIFRGTISRYPYTATHSPRSNP